MIDDPHTDDKGPIEQALDVLVYAPIGLLFDGSTILPQLVERGRSQVTMARMIGKFAVEQGRAEATKTASKLGDQAAGLLDFLGDSLTPVQTEPAPPPRPAGRPGTASRNGPSTSGRAAAAARTGAKVGGAATPAAAPTKDETATKPTKPAKASKASGAAGPSKGSKGSKASGSSKGSPPAGVADLAIPDYDGLSASHVVNRLGGLSADELEAVRRYEAANRGRKTILSKIAQLQSA